MSIHPLKAIVSSVIFILLLGLLRKDAGFAFHEALTSDIKILGFVGFNLFADGLSLAETRWLLRRAVKSALRGLLVLLVIDLLLSAAIFLLIPLILGELPALWEAIFFEGDRPWLGILFWSTFSTSVVFYLFVIAAVLVRLFAALARFFGWATSPLQAHPVLCIAIAMALVVTVGFAGVGAWRVVG